MAQRRPKLEKINPEEAKPESKLPERSKVDHLPYDDTKSKRNLYQFLEGLLDRLNKREQRKLIKFALYSLCIILIFLVPTVGIIYLVTYLKKILIH